MSLSSSSQPWGLTGEGWSPGICVGVFVSSLSFLSSLQTVSFTFQTDENLLVVSSSSSSCLRAGPVEAET